MARFLSLHISKRRVLSILMAENGSLMTVFRFAYPEPKSSRHSLTPAAINPSITIPNPALYSVATVSVISNCIQSWWISISSIIRIKWLLQSLRIRSREDKFTFILKSFFIRSRCSFINMQTRLNCRSVICSII